MTAPSAPLVCPEGSVGCFLRRHAVAVALAAAAFAALFWPTMRGLVRYWSEDPDFSHGFLIPVVSGGILFSERRRLAALAARRSIGGLILLLLSTIVFLAGSLSFTNILERAALWGALLGAVGFLLGPDVVRRKPFPFLFLLLAIPPPYFLITPVRLALKGFATRFAADVLSLLGYAALSEGNVLALGDHRLEVADACSGIRSLMAIVSTAILFSYIFRTGPWRGLALTLTAIPVTVAVNVLRIVILAVALNSLQVDWTHGAEHEIVGYAVFGVSLALLYGFLRFYDWLFRWEAGGPSRPRPAQGSARAEGGA